MLKTFCASVPPSSEMIEVRLSSRITGARNLFLFLLVSKDNKKRYINERSFKFCPHFDFNCSSLIGMIFFSECDILETETDCLLGHKWRSRWKYILANGVSFGIMCLLLVNILLTHISLKCKHQRINFRMNSIFVISSSKLYFV